jgi:two-component system, OmpR family, flagellar system response regulator FtcR
VWVIAMNDTKSLDETLELFAAGVDDVVRKPIHVRKILARI